MLGPLWQYGVLLIACLGILQSVRLILRLLRSIGRIQLSILGIRLVILLSLGEVKSLLVALTQSKISSLVYSVWSSSHSILYRARVIVTYLSLLTYIPQLRRKVCRLQITKSLQALKVASVKSAKSSQYYSYRLLFIKL